MIYIAHRGNLKGPNIDNENHPDYINEAIRAGFDVEIDIWFIDDKYVLGHDHPLILVKEKFLLTNGLWVHAKNIEALDKLHGKIEHLFFHDSDDAVLTSSNYIWTYVGKRPLTKNSIAVLPEQTNYTLSELKTCAGICSDKIVDYRRLIG